MGREERREKREGRREKREEGGRERELTTCSIPNTVITSFFSYADVVILIMKMLLKCSSIAIIESFNPSCCASKVLKTARSVWSGSISTLNLCNFNFPCS